MSKRKSILLTVIVPVHNAVDYLPRMIDGLISQNFNRLEVIFIDDKSSDNSLELLRKYESNYDWISVYALDENKGVGFARNYGVKKSKGEYLAFHDADDWMMSNSYTYFDRHVIKHEYPDLIFFPYSVYNSNFEKVKHIKKKLDSLPDQLTGKDVFIAICNGKLNPATWNKVFKKTSWEKSKLCFDSEFFEDLSFIPYACLKMEHASYMPSAEYCYFLNDGGMTKVISERLVSASYDGLIALENKIQGEIEYEKIKENFTRFAINTFCHNFFYSNRNSLFTNSQVVEFASLFQKFCLDHSLTFLHLLNNDDALKLIRGFLNERKKRNLSQADQIKLSIDEIDDVLNHYQILVSQFDLLLSKSGDIIELQNKWSRKTKRLRRKIQKRNQRIETLEKRSKRLLKINLILRKLSSLFG